MSEKSVPSAESAEAEPKERFRPRDIGTNYLACFVCNGIKYGYPALNDVTDEPSGEQVPSIRDADGIHYTGIGYQSSQPDMPALVDSKEAGERVVGMFQLQGSRAFLDYNPSEPANVQVKIGACDDHLPNLQSLRALAKEAGGMITPSMIAASMTPPELKVE